MVATLVEILEEITMGIGEMVMRMVRGKKGPPISLYNPFTSNIIILPGVSPDEGDGSLRGGRMGGKRADPHAQG